MAARHTPTVAGPFRVHPLSQPSRPTWVVIVLVGWLAFLGWRPEQSLTLLLLLFPAASASTAGELG